MTQTQRVLRHLQDFGSITSLEAFQDYGITRLSGRIYDLRAQGIAITSDTVTSKNRYGEPTHYAKYRLEV